MANQGQLALIRQGVKKWNQWCEEKRTKPDLSGADLTGVNFTQADLSGANLTGAGLWETLFINVNLEEVVGLDTCEHHGPSVLDYRTLAQSGQLPLQFLRGCGLPDKLIDYLPSRLLTQGTQFYSCFISYSTQDQEFADRLYADLQASQWAAVVALDRKFMGLPETSQATEKIQ